MRVIANQVHHRSNVVWHCFKVVVELLFITLKPSNLVSQLLPISIHCTAHVNFVFCLTGVDGVSTVAQLTVWPYVWKCYRRCSRCVCNSVQRTNCLGVNHNTIKHCKNSGVQLSNCGFNAHVFELIWNIDYVIINLTRWLVLAKICIFTRSLMHSLSRNKTFRCFNLLMLCSVF
jgi:hypothetical protein